MRGMGVCQDDIFSIARGNIVAIRLQKQSAMHLIFYITIRDEFIVSHMMVEAIHTSSSRRMSVVVVLSILAARKITCQEVLTLNYVIFVLVNSLLCQMVVIGHGDHDRGITEDKQKKKKCA
jgi:hypothetical protein